VAAALQLLDARSTDGLRLGDLAADLGMDPTYLARAFRQQMGCTMSQYRRRLWVRQAAHLLASTDTPLSHVALSSGFADQSHFCRVFKAEMGLTPQSYRLLARPG
jgi:AraC family transcriptional regulator